MFFPLSHASVFPLSLRRMDGWATYRAIRSYMLRREKPLQLNFLVFLHNALLSVGQSSPPLWLHHPPTMATALLISYSPGGLLCIFYCSCFRISCAVRADGSRADPPQPEVSHLSSSSVCPMCCLNTKNAMLSPLCSCYSRWDGMGWIPPGMVSGI